MDCSLRYAQVDIFYIMMATWAICFYKENGKHLTEELIRMIWNLRLYEHFKQWVKKKATSVQLEISYFILKHIQINKYYWKT